MIPQCPKAHFMIKEFIRPELDNDQMTQHNPVDVDMAAGHASEDHATKQKSPQ
jgi:hypothetical protein